MFTVYRFGSASLSLYLSLSLFPYVIIQYHHCVHIIPFIFQCTEYTHTHTHTRYDARVINRTFLFKRHHTIKMVFKSFLFSSFPALTLCAHWPRIDIGSRKESSSIEHFQHIKLCLCLFLPFESKIAIFVLNNGDEVMWISWSSEWMALLVLLFSMHECVSDFLPNQMVRCGYPQPGFILMGLFECTLVRAFHYGYIYFQLNW